MCHYLPLLYYVHINYHYQIIIIITYSIVHVLGKDLCIADTVSKAPLPTISVNEAFHHHEVEMFVNFVIKHLPATERRLSLIRKVKKVKKSVGR